MKLFEASFSIHDNGHEYCNDALIQSTDSIAATEHLKEYCRTLYEDEVPEWEDDRWFFPESYIYVKPGYVGEISKNQWMTSKYEDALI
jgi:hypothetical protein